MCVTFVYLRPRASGDGSRYKLIVLNSRDEAISRATSKLAWEDGILCGRDEQATERGTWFGAAESGKVGVLLSITQPHADKDPHAPSRGGIVPEYLRSELPGPVFVQNLSKVVKPFNGFQFLAFDRNVDGGYGLTTVVHKYVDESLPRTWPIDGGVYGFGNSPPEQAYQKVLHGTKLFESTLSSIVNNEDTDFVFNQLLTVAKNKDFCEPDEQFQLQTGFDRETCHFLTALFIQQQPGGNYGTRSHSVFLVDLDDNATFYESRLVSGTNLDGEWENTVERFKIK